MLRYKKKYKRSNQMSFVTKYIFKVIMKRLKLRNNYLKNKIHVNKMLYNLNSVNKEKSKPIIM